MVTLIKFGRIEAGAVSTAGFVLFCELGAAVRWNITFLQREIVFDPRFNLYLCAAVGLAALFMIRGFVAVSSTGLAMRLFAIVEAPATLIIAALAVVIAHGWRLATDTVPANRVDAEESLPLIVTLLARPAAFWGTAVTVAVILLSVFWRIHRRTASESA